MTAADAHVRALDNVDYMRRLHRYRRKDLADPARRYTVRSVARHEAGHITAAAALGATLHEARIKPPPKPGWTHGGNCTYGLPCFPQGDDYAWAQAVCLWASAVASDSLLCFDGDFDLIHALGERYAYDRSPGSPLAGARHVIATHWPVVEAVAAVLHQDGYVSAGTLTELTGHIRPRNTEQACPAVP